MLVETAARTVVSISCGVGQISLDRKSTRLNSSHQIISYAVFCLKKKKKYLNQNHQSYPKFAQSLQHNTINQNVRPRNKTSTEAQESCRNLMHSNRPRWQHVGYG